MEFMNIIQLRGVVGRTDVGSYNGNRVCNFSVVTEYASRDREGNSAVETTWFNASLWEIGGEVNPEIDKIQKGSWVEVTGRLRVRKYIAIDNVERTALDVFARSIKVLKRDDISMQPQRDM
jgi:single-stranded DNA-binding protein